MPVPEPCVILFAEDDPTVRNMVQTLLTRAGYTALTAADGQEALDISRKYGGNIHLLLTDVQMPRMDGLTLIEHLRQERPEIKVLVMSGKVSGEIHAQAATWRFLRKPFLPRDLRRQLRELLDEPDAIPCAPDAITT